VCSGIDCCGGSGIIFFGFSFVWFSHAKPKSQSGMRVEYLHNLSTRIVVVGWEVELFFMRSVAGGVLDVL